jgi:chromosome partitioning protein
MSIIAVVGDKGGVGRTTLVRLLAEYLARRDYNVLCVGLDPHAAMARRFGYDMHGADRELKSSVKLFDKGVQPGDAAELIVPVRWDVEKYPWAARIHLIPDHDDLVAFDCPPVQGTPAKRPRRALEGVADQYDFCLVDPAPRTAGTLAHAPWDLADWLLGLSAARRDEIEGIFRLMQRVKDDRDEIGNPTLDVRGIALNEFNPRSPKQQQNVIGLRNGADEEHPGLVWDRHIEPDGTEVSMAIPDKTAISDAFDDDLPIAGISRSRDRKPIDTPMNLIVNKVLEVSGDAAA